MKSVLSLIVLVSAFAITARANDGKTYPGGCAGEFLGTCTEVDGSGDVVGPNLVVCMARDSANIKYTYTASYSNSTHETAQLAVKNCTTHSKDPKSCHWTACKWAD